jgi:hypothetical protein
MKTVDQINDTIVQAVKMLESDTTGKYARQAPFSGSPDILPGCIVYAVGTCTPTGALELQSDQINYDALQIAYDRYMQMCKTAQQMAQQIIADSKTPLYYHNGKKFVKIHAAAAAVEMDCPAL